MRLLLDANISRSLVERLADTFPHSSHVDLVGLGTASDAEVWEYAAEHDFVIVSKDEDFHQLAFLHGPPPKVVWVRLGNCRTVEIETALREAAVQMSDFVESEHAAFLILERFTR